MIDGWGEQLRASLGEDYEIIDSQNFVVVSGMPSSQGDVLTRSMERARDRILLRLRGAAVDREYPRHLAVLFHDENVFLEYVANFYSDGGEYGTPGGLYIPDGLGHLVISPGSISAQEAAITHELTHVLLSHLGLPQWLDEGLARSMEISCGLRHSSIFDKEKIDKHRNYWNAERLGRFWIGETFYNIDDGQSLSYSLAEFLVKALPGSEAQRLEFVRHAKIDDGGQQAARDILDVELSELIAPLIGEESLE